MRPTAGIGHPECTSDSVSFRTKRWGAVLRVAGWRIHSRDSLEHGEFPQARVLVRQTILLTMFGLTMFGRAQQAWWNIAALSPWVTAE
jgi:hypothetical protein